MNLTTRLAALCVAGVAEERAAKCELDRINLTTATGELEVAGVAEERAAKNELDS